jgi:subtilase family serine protease
MSVQKPAGNALQYRNARQYPRRGSRVRPSGLNIQYATEARPVLANLKTALLGATICCAAFPAWAALPALPATTPLITGAIDEAALATLTGDHSDKLSLVQDRGALDATHVLSHVTVGLKRQPAMQAAFDRLVHEQTQKGSAHYHDWLAASDLRRFGPAQADIDRVVAWLQSHNLTVNGVSPSGMSIDVGGRAGDFAAAFHTALHNVALKGEAHIANIADPAIPAALTPVVHGVTLSNFFPKPDVIPSRPLFTVPATGNYPQFEAVVPADFATIYNLNPLFNGTAYGYPITGAGVTIAVVEQTDIRPNDIAKFRGFFGLSGYKGTLTVAHPGNCGDPGYTGDEGEAALDGEWSGAAAPDADVIEASCPGSETTFGVETTLQNLVELASTPATIYSISYGGSEAGNGLTFLTGWANLIEEGASEGISIMVSSGDSGSGADESVNVNGLAVNGLASNEYDTAVGGTDFYDTALGEVAQYWSAHNSGSGRASVKSYVPEIPWDNSCANAIIAKVEGGTGGLAYCNETPTGGIQNGVGGGGGQSIYYAKPDWQLTSILGVPNDGVRDLPDVSLFAANGIWNHFYLYCMSDANEGGAPCKYTGVSSSGVPNALYNAAGGTSFAAPAFAGVMAVISSGNNDRRLGNVAPRLYQLAATQYGNTITVSRCNATLGKAISPACVFNDVTAGDNAEPCVKGTPNCYVNKTATMGIGVLSASTGKNEVNAFPANPGYSLATGLGTVNVTNLLVNY